MKNLNIAGVVASSKETTISDVKYLELSIALNDPKKTFVKVMHKHNNLTVLTGSVVAASGDFDVKSNHDAKSGKTYANITLWTHSFQVLNKPKAQERSEPAADAAIVEIEAKAEQVIESDQEAQVQDKSEAALTLESALEQIKATKTVKQCGYMFYNVVNKLVGDEDRKAAQAALNARKNEISKQTKAA